MALTLPATRYGTGRPGDSAATWQEWTHTGTGRSAKITTIPVDGNDVHLEPRTQYEVQVRALNAEGNPGFDDDPNDNWSTSGRGTTGASNERPVFDSTLPVVVEMEVEENTRSGQSVGSAIEATDPDNNRLTYTLEGPGKDSLHHHQHRADTDEGRPQPRGERPSTR